MVTEAALLLDAACSYMHDPLLWPGLHHCHELMTHFCVSSTRGTPRHVSCLLLQGAAGCSG